MTYQRNMGSRLVGGVLIDEPRRRTREERVERGDVDAHDDADDDHARRGLPELGTARPLHAAELRPALTDELPEARALVARSAGRPRAGTARRARGRGP